jgi:hypothetical protein
MCTAPAGCLWRRLGLGVGGRAVVHGGVAVSRYRSGAQRCDAVRWMLSEAPELAGYLQPGLVLGRLESSNGPSSGYVYVLGGCTTSHSSLLLCNASYRRGDERHTRLCPCRVC